jgi:hypothetical protein
MNPLLSESNSFICVWLKKKQGKYKKYELRQQKKLNAV